MEDYIARTLEARKQQEHLERKNRNRRLLSLALTGAGVLLCVVCVAALAGGGYFLIRHLFDPSRTKSINDQIVEIVQEFGGIASLTEVEVHNGKVTFDRNQRVVSNNVVATIKLQAMIDLSGSRIDDAGFRRLCGLLVKAQLASLSLHVRDTAITEEGLEGLRELPPDVYCRIDVSDSKVTEQGIENLQGLSSRIEIVNKSSTEALSEPITTAAHDQTAPVAKSSPPSNSSDVTQPELWPVVKDDPYGRIVVRLSTASIVAGEICCCGFSGDGSRFVCVSPHAVICMDMAAMESRTKSADENKEEGAIEVIDESDLIPLMQRLDASSFSSSDETVYQPTELGIVRIGSNHGIGAALIPQSNKLLLIDSVRTLRFLDLQTGTVTAEATLPMNAADDGALTRIPCAVSMDGQVVAYRAIDGVALVRLTENTRRLAAFEVPQLPTDAETTALEFTPHNGALLTLTDTNDRLLGQLWDPWVAASERTLSTDESFEPIAETDLGSISATTISSDGSMLATGTARGGIRLWSLPLSTSFENIGTGALLNDPDFNATDITAIAVSPDTRFVVTAHLSRANSLQGRIWVWDLQREQRRNLAMNPDQRVHALRFSSDGRWLMAYGSEWFDLVEVAEPLPPKLPATIAHTPQDGEMPVTSEAQLPGEGTQEQVVRTWTDTTGNFQVSAEFAGYKSGKVRLKKEDGSEVAVPIEKLSEPDKEYLRALWREKGQRPSF